MEPPAQALVSLSQPPRKQEAEGAVEPSMTNLTSITPVHCGHNSFDLWVHEALAARHFSSHSMKGISQRRGKQCTTYLYGSRVAPNQMHKTPPSSYPAHRGSPKAAAANRTPPYFSSRARSPAGSSRKSSCHLFVVLTEQQLPSKQRLTCEPFGLCPKSTVHRRCSKTLRFFLTKDA